MMDRRCNCEFECCHPNADCSNPPHAQIEAYGLKVTLCAHCISTWEKFDVAGALELTDQLKEQGIECAGCGHVDCQCDLERREAEEMWREQGIR
jgi:hypothetical protein